MIRKSSEESQSVRQPVKDCCTLTLKSFCLSCKQSANACMYAYVILFKRMPERHQKRLRKRTKRCFSNEWQLKSYVGWLLKGVVIWKRTVDWKPLRYCYCLRLKAERPTKAKRRKVESGGCLKSPRAAAATWWWSEADQGGEFKNDSNKLARAKASRGAGWRADVVSGQICCCKWSEMKWNDWDKEAFNPLFRLVLIRLC